MEVYSAADSNADSVCNSNCKVLFHLDVSLDDVYRVLQDFDDQTVGGGANEVLEVEDGSLAADLVNRSITSDKIVDQTFQRRRFPTYELTINKIEDDSLDAELFKRLSSTALKLKMEIEFTSFRTIFF